ncbi:MAG: hypothetical protein HC902_10095 [Calothrix sp. SM1_5_4]|nr:hypothetical protein [Calothrix sp. SM1_5_4]
MKSTRLRILRPLQSQTVHSEEATRIPFVWERENARPAGASERFTLEFSGDPSFTTIHMAKSVQGQMETSMRVSRSLSLFFRVKGPNNEISPTEKVNFVRTEKPVIIRPLAGEKISAPPRGQPGVVAVEIQRPLNTTVWYQVADSESFDRVLVSRTLADPMTKDSLPPGNYFIRARSNYGQNNLTSWTEPRPFAVESELEIFPLAKHHLPRRVLIPNRDYPFEMYSAAPDRVNKFLARNGFLKNFFPDGADEITVEVDGENFVPPGKSWPQEKLNPGYYSYRYQASKMGYRPSDWSSAKKLEIQVEPVRPLGPTLYGEADESGQREASWNFTPLLFARSYDVEVSPFETFDGAIELRTTEANARLKLPEGDYYWRARARDGKGRIISAFSDPYRMDTMPRAIPRALAQSEPEPESKPVERIKTKVERKSGDQWEKSGWWAWLGTGGNYVDYRQSIPGRGALNYQNVKAPSQYFEGGFTGSSGMGA